MALSLCLNRETIQNQNICTLGWPQVYQQWTAAFHQIMTAWVGSSTQQQLGCKKTKRFYSCYNWFYAYVRTTMLLLDIIYLIIFQLQQQLILSISSFINFQSSSLVTIVT